MTLGAIMTQIADLPDEQYFGVYGSEFLANIDPFEFSLAERTPTSDISRYLFRYYNSMQQNQQHQHQN